MPNRQHYVTFFSPGSFVAESSCKPIDAWDPVEAMRLCQGITERYGAKPYGFQFETRIVADPVPDGEGGELQVTPKKVAESEIYYIDGRILKFDEVPETDSTRIMRDNMRSNDYPIVVETTRGFRWTQPFKEHDVIVSEQGEVLRRGDDAGLIAYRNVARIQFKAYYDALRAEYGLTGGA